MTWFEALILGIVQGLTEFLPVSSSGHLEIGKVLLNTEVQKDITFTVLVHFATVLSTITVFYRDLTGLTTGLFAFKWNEETKFVSKILLSMIPVLFVGVFLKDQVESLFTGNLVLVGIALLVTALLLFTAQLVKGGNKRIPFSDAFLIGVAQAVAVIPGISRSGATISAGLILKNDRSETARFSFLMVLIPIIGAALLDLLTADAVPGEPVVPASSLVTGFLAAYVSGFLACSWMIRLVKRGKLYWFAAYCTAIGIISIIFA